MHVEGLTYSFKEVSDYLSRLSIQLVTLFHFCISAFCTFKAKEQSLTKGLYLEIVVWCPFLIWTAIADCQEKSIHWCQVYEQWLAKEHLFGPFNLDRDAVTFLDYALFLMYSPSYTRRKIWLIESNAKCRHLKKWPEKGLCSRYLSVWGQESWTRDKVRETTVHKAGSKIQTWLTVSSVYKLW